MQPTCKLELPEKSWFMATYRLVGEILLEKVNFFNFAHILEPLHCIGAQIPDCSRIIVNCGERMNPSPESSLSGTHHCVCGLKATLGAAASGRPV